MASHEVSVTDVSRRFSEYLNRVAYKGDHFFLRRAGAIVAELKPAPKGRRLGDLPALLKSLPRLSAIEIKRFSRDVQIARRSTFRHKIRDPWES